MLGAIRRLFGASAAPPASDDDFWYGPAVGATASGMRVTAETAMRASAVYACVRILAETRASLPVGVFRRVGPEAREPAPDHPVHAVLRAPNARSTRFTFSETLQAHLALRGNGYAEIIADNRGTVRKLFPFHPDLVTPEPVDRDRLRYRVRDPKTGIERVLVQEEMLHIPGLSFDGVKGLNPIEYEREAIGMTLAAQDYGARMFANDARPGGVLEHPTGFKDEEDLDKFKRSWAASYGGNNRGKTAILTNGMKYNAIGMTAEDAQFLDTRKFQVEEIARIFRIPLVLLQHTEKSTSWGTGIEQLMIGFVVHTMLPWLIRWEEELNRSLLLPAEQDEFFIRFNLAGLLRGDMKSRYAAYAVGRQWGWLSVNEIRALEEMNPIDDGDTYLEPLNMGPTGDAAADTDADDREAAPPRDEQTARRLRILRGTLRDKPKWSNGHA